MNALTNRGSNALAALGALKQGLQNVATAIVATGGDPYLRLLKDGAWVYGADNVEVEDKSEWAVNPLSLMHGFTVWSDYKKKKNEKLGAVMVPATMPLPPRSELAKTVDDEGNTCEWQQALSMTFQCMTGDDEGVQVEYNTTSLGGMNASKSLINAIMRHLEVDESRPVPIITLASSSYNHSQYGKTYVPEFDIVDWVPLDDKIMDPIKPTDAPDSDTKAETAPVEAQQVRSRRGADSTRDDRTRSATPEELAAIRAAREGITAEDRRAALDNAVADLATERRAAPVEQEAAPARRRQRR